MTIQEFISGVTINITTKTQRNSITPGVVGGAFTNLANIVAAGGGGSTGGTITTGKWKDTVDVDGGLLSIYDLSNNGSFSPSAVTKTRNYGDLSLSGSTNGFNTNYFDFSRFLGGAQFNPATGNEKFESNIPSQFNGGVTITNMSFPVTTGGSSSSVVFRDQDGKISSMFGSFSFDGTEYNVSDKMLLQSGLKIASINAPIDDSGGLLFIDGQQNVSSLFGTFGLSDGVFGVHIPMDITSPIKYTGTPSLTGTSAYGVFWDNGALAPAYGTLIYNADSSEMQITCDTIFQSGIVINGVNQPDVSSGEAGFLLRDSSGQISSLYNDFKYTEAGIEIVPFVKIMNGMYLSGLNSPVTTGGSANALFVNSDGIISASYGVYSYADGILSTQGTKIALQNPNSTDQNNTGYTVEIMGRRSDNSELTTLSNIIDYKTDEKVIEISSAINGLVLNSSTGERVQISVSVTGGSPTLELTIL